MSACERKLERNRCMAYQMMEQNREILIIDIRSVVEHEEIHIEKSVVVHDLLINRYQMEQYYSPKTEAIFIYCRSGASSERAVCILQQLGYTNVYNIGSVYDWQWNLAGSMVK